MRHAKAVLEVGHRLRSHGLVGTGERLAPVGVVDRVVNKHARLGGRRSQLLRCHRCRPIKVDAIHARLLRREQPLFERFPLRHAVFA